MRLIAFLLFSLPAIATIRCVGSAPTGVTCGVSTTANAAGLQSALDAAAAGDTIYVQEGGYSGAFYFRTNGDAENPITVTTRKVEWLPCSACRLTPSHLPNLPMLSSPTPNAPALLGYKDGSGNPPKGWKFIGIGFGLGYHNTNHDNSIIVTGGNGIGVDALGGGGTPWYISGASNAPSSLTFDRIFARARHQDTYYTLNHMMLNGSNINVKNSFFWPLYGAGSEVHSLAVLTGPGPVTLTNNFVSAMSIPIFTGGSAPDYVGGGPGDFTATDNFIYRPWKWFSGASNPFPDYYTDNDGHYGCVKNLGEHKAIFGFGLWDRNVHENNWMDGNGGSCAGQWFGFTLTMRQTGWGSPAYVGGNIYGSSYWMDGTFVPPAGCNAVYACTGSLTTSGTNFSWKSAMNTAYPTSQWISPGHNVCLISLAQTLDVDYQLKWVYDCRKVATIISHDVTGATASTGTLAAAFTRDINPSWSTTLTAGVDASTLTIPVADDSGIAAFDMIRIDQEWALVCSKSMNVLTLCSSTYGFSGPAGRGFLANNATSHAMGTVVARHIFWSWVQDPDASVENVTITNSVFRNVGAGMNILAKDRVGWSPDANGTTAGRIAGFTIRNVLFEDTVPDFVHNFAWKLYPEEEANANQSGISGSDFVMENLTFKWLTNPWNVIGFVGDGAPDELHPKIQNLTIRNNILPDASCGDSNCYSLSFSGSSINYNSWTHAANFAEGTQYFGHNQFGYVSESCSTVDCPGNHAETAAVNADYHTGTVKLKSTSAIAKGGSDGADIGANSDQLPLIKNVRVTVGQYTAVLEYDLTGPIKDAASSQPCMLEVSPNENLRSYIHSGGAEETIPYTTINALNPAYFKQPDQSNTTNVLLLTPLVEGAHVYWPIGRNASVTGDDSVSHNLALSAGTTYYGRLMCYGDTNHFQFTTAAASSGATAIAMSFKPPTGVDSVKVEYGPTAALGSEVTDDVSSGSAAVSVPVTAGVHIYLKTTYLDSGDQPVGKVSQQIRVP